MCKQAWPPSSSWLTQAPATPKLCMGVGHQQRLSRGRDSRPGVRACSLPKGVHRQVPTPTPASGQRELSLRMPGCSPWAPPGLTAPCECQVGAGWDGLSYPWCWSHHETATELSAKRSDVYNPLVLTRLLSSSPQHPPKGICTTLLLSPARCSLRAKQCIFLSLQQQ